ncbi:MAG: helix-turn-helix domain-containing protein [bacterium]|nr:helix-turn-helix domain-containing protein [bacterium]
MISRHITLLDHVENSLRQEHRFEPPLEIDLSLGKVSSILNSQMAPKGTSSRSLRKCKPIINANGILHINEVMKAGETISIVLRPGFRLKDVVLGDAHQLQMLVDEQGFHYWFTVGQDGVLEVTGEIVKDRENLFSKLRKDLTDLPMRAYIVQGTLLDRKGIPSAIVAPDVMTTAEAADYLSLSTSKVYKLAQSGILIRTPQKRFRKSDLDHYMRSQPKKRR